MESQKEGHEDCCPLKGGPALILGSLSKMTPTQLRMMMVMVTVVMTMMMMMMMIVIASRVFQAPAQLAL